MEKIADMANKDVSYIKKNRQEENGSGVLKDMNSSGILVSYESRGALFTEFISHTNLDSLYIRQPLAE